MSEQNQNHLTPALSDRAGLAKGGEGVAWEKMTMTEQMSAARDRQASFRLEAEVRKAARARDLDAREIDALVEKARGAESEMRDLIKRRMWIQERRETTDKGRETVETVKTTLGRKHPAKAGC